MDEVFVRKIGKILEKEHPTENDIVEGATLLLRINQQRYRALYNTAVRRPRQMQEWIRRELKKHYEIRQRGLESSEVRKFNEETVRMVEQTLSVAPVQQEEDDKSIVPVLGVRGRRDDHDSLPDDIKDLWEKNAERWKKMRQMHAQLAAMIARPDYQPCDGNELCYALRQADTDLRNDYNIYDSFVIDARTETAEEKVADSVDVFTDNVKTIQNARTCITRNLKNGQLSDAQLAKVQDAVNALVALRQEFKPETLARLKAAGVSVPEM